MAGGLEEPCRADRLPPDPGARVPVPEAQLGLAETERRPGPRPPGAPAPAAVTAEQDDPRVARAARLGARTQKRPGRYGAPGGHVDPVTVCTARCRSSLRAVRLALEDLGWREAEVDDRSIYSVMWREHADNTADLCPAIVTSKLGGFLRLCKKVRFASALRAAEAAGGARISPRTWLLPNEADALRRRKRKGALIAKPACSSQGKGIVLATKVQHLQDTMIKSNEKDQWVVQEYLEPALLQGCKFDLRLYVVVVGFGDALAFEAYLFDDGLARVCSVPYRPPRAANRECREMHLTNFAVQKEAEGFVPSGDEGASKRPAREALASLAEEAGLPSDELWDRCRGVCAEAVAALRIPIVEAAFAAESAAPFPARGFQILGVDLLLDANLRPWILEVNANPSLSLLEPSELGKLISDLDEGLKTRLIAQALEAARPLSDKAARRAQQAWDSGEVEAVALGKERAEDLDWFGPEDAPGLASWNYGYIQAARLFERFASARWDLTRGGFARLAPAAGLLGPGGRAGTAFDSKVAADCWWASVSRAAPVDVATFVHALAERAKVVAPAGLDAGQALSWVLASPPLPAEGDA